MRYTLRTLGAAFMALTLSTSAASQSTRCPSIKDTDERMICNAVTSHNESWCGFVKDSSKRSWCYVLVRGK